MSNATRNTIRPRLVFKNEQGAQQEVSIKKPQVVIGRAEDADVRLDHLRVSRQHAFIVQQGRDYFLVDNASANGTKLRGEELLKGDQAGPLLHNDKITICRDDRYELTFLLWDTKVEPETETDPFPYQNITVRLEEASYLYHYIFYKYPLVWLYGSAGTGKSHLLQALTNPTLQEHLHSSEHLEVTRFWKNQPALLYFDAEAELEDIRPGPLVGGLLQQLRRNLEMDDPSLPDGSLRQELNQLASSALTATDGEALDLLDRGYKVWLKRQARPLTFLLDGSDALLAELSLEWWQNLSNLIKRRNDIPNGTSLRVVLASRVNLDYWRERKLKKSSPTERRRVEREIELWRGEVQVQALEKLSEEAAQLVANYSLIAVGGAANTLPKRLETAFGAQPQGCYRNGQPIDHQVFQLVAKRVRQLGGQHPGLIRSIAATLIQQLVPPEPDLLLLSDRQSEPILIDKLLEDDRVLSECEEIYASLSAEQNQALGWLSQVQPARTKSKLPGDNTEAALTQKYHVNNFDWSGYEQRGLVFRSTRPYPQIFSPVFGAYLAHRSEPTSDQKQPTGGKPSPIGRPSTDTLELVQQRFQPEQCWLIADLNRHTISICGLPPIQITSPNSWRLFEYLYQKPYQVVPETTLMEYLYGQPGRPYTSFDVDKDRFEAVVKRLRQQIEPWRDSKKIFLVNLNKAYELRPGTKKD